MSFTFSYHSRDPVYDLITHSVHEGGARKVCKLFVCAKAIEFAAFLVVRSSMA